MCFKLIERVCRHMYSTFERKKDDLIIETGLNVTLVSRPFAAPLSDRKKKLWSAPKMVPFVQHGRLCV